MDGGSMRHFIAFLLIAVSSVGCREDSMESSEVSSLEDELDLRAQAWRQNVPFCEGFPAKDGCDDGDATLFNGLLCATGVSEGCEAVQRAQSGDGRWWRSPRRVDGNLGQGRSFSRDMALGVLLYLTTTGDRDAANRWLDWMERNRPCTVRNPITGGCTIRGLHRFCPDDENQICTVTPNVWALMGDVWDHLGLGRHPNMQQFGGAYVTAAVAEATNAPVGYELHLKGVSAFILKRLNKRGSTTNEVASRLVGRQPGNPFFRYLSEGFSPTAREQVLAVCPRVDAEISWQKRQWTWERDTGEEAWRETMLWDCLFAAELRKI